MDAVSNLIRITVFNVDNDHLTGSAFIRRLCRQIAAGKCFVDIGKGSDMRRCSLQRGELNRSGLQACLCGNLVCQGNGTAGKLLVAESINIVSAAAQLAHETAVGNLDSFGYGNNNGVFFSSQFFNSCQEIIHIEGSLRNINHIRSAAVLTAGKSCRRCQPAGMASHNLADQDGRLLNTEGLVIADNFLHGCCNILCCGCIARAVIGNRKVIIDGLRNTHKSLLFALHRRIIGKHLHRIHRVISADVEQDFDIVFLKNLEDFIVDFFVAFDFRKFITAGSKECRRSSLQQFDILVIPDILSHINKIVLQESFDTMMHTVNFLNSDFSCIAYNACKRRVDYSGRTA